MRVLFLSDAQPQLSQAAAAFAHRLAADDMEIVSADTRSREVAAVTAEALVAGTDTRPAQQPALLETLKRTKFDLVIAFDDASAEKARTLGGPPRVVQWALSDNRGSVGDSPDPVQLEQLGQEMRRRVDVLFRDGYMRAFAEISRMVGTMLDSVSDGVICHDMKRRIFLFNEAARNITGYSEEEVMGRDCHEVFPGNFCGGKCVFCEPLPANVELLEREVEVVTKSGEKRIIRMTVNPLFGSAEKQIGVLGTFRDSTHELRLARRVGKLQQFAGIIGRDKKMLELFDVIRELAETSVPVLIQGESGTGKELVAAAIHNEGFRAGKLFVPVNCGALPESLLESELFGHVRGAFTGAIRDKKGRFELADGGTIFLDEIGDISPAMQVKLLRVIQEGTFERVGSEKTLKVDVRVISATNKVLYEEVAAGRFREDLYYRLSVVPITLPPLRERRNDIPLLVDYVLKQILEDLGREGITVSQEALDIMLSYDWPGNVRELQNWLQFAMVKRREGEIGPEHLPVGRSTRAASTSRPRKRKLDVQSVRSALREASGNKVEAARLLGVSRATLYRFLDEVNPAQ